MLTMVQRIEIAVETNAPKRGISGEIRFSTLKIIIKVITEPPTEPLTIPKRKKSCKSKTYRISKRSERLSNLYFHRIS